MLTPTLPDLNALDREALLKLLLAEHDERVAIHQRLLARETLATDRIAKPSPTTSKLKWTEPSITSAPSTP